MVQRLIAQGVLWAMLTGMFAPLAPAVVMPRACCLRHQQHCHMPHDAGFSSPSVCHQCCRLLAVSTALFAPVEPGAQGNLPRAHLISSSGLVFQSFRALAERSERAPPAAN